MTGKLFVISGPSGVGKGTLVEELMRRRDGLWLSVSATTRSPRASDVPGSYIFLTDEQFDELIATGGLFEWAYVHGARYGTPSAPVIDKLAQGADVVLEIDPQGALQAREKVSGAYLIFVMPPSMEELERRLRGRGTETDEQVKSRLETAKLEMQLESRYNYSLVNDDLQRAVDELVCVVDSQLAGS